MALTVSVASKLALLSERGVRSVIANAMTAAGRQAQAGLYQAAPRFIDSPTRWTLGGIPQRTFAKPADLAINLGFATERRGRGSPAGRYVNPLAAGTGPHIKGADLSATKIARVGRGAVLVPARSAGFLDGDGNVPLRRQVQILSAARSTTSGSGRGALNSTTVFIAPVRRGSSTLAIFERKEGFMRRSNTLERTTRRLFTIEPNPKIRRRQFPVRDVVEQSFSQAWRRAMAEAFEAELARLK